MVMNKLTDDITRVEFRKSRNPYTKEMEVVAIFVDENWDTDGKEFACYMHYGQHSGCDKAWAKHLRFATVEEYTPLKQELERCFDYQFKVLNKAA